MHEPPPKLGSDESEKAYDLFMEHTHPLSESKCPMCLCATVEYAIEDLLCQYVRLSCYCETCESTWYPSYKMKSIWAIEPGHENKLMETLAMYGGLEDAE